MKTHAFHTASRVLISLTTTLLCVSNLWAWPGGVVRQGSEIGWGQYRGIKGVVAVGFSQTESTAPPLARSIQDFPFSGASAVMLYAQRPGQPFFAPDGASIDPARLERLAGQIDALCKFDMLPIVVLFDPHPSCRLASEQAYGQAARTLQASIGQGRWYLPCVTDQADAVRWGEGPVAVNGIGLVRLAAHTLRAGDAQQVVAGGGHGEACLQALSAGDDAIDVLLHRLDRLERGRQRPAPSDRLRIDVVAASHVTAPALRDSLIRVGIARYHEHFPYGLAFHFDDVPPADRSAARRRFLDLLQRETDAMQKEILHALPPVPGDTFSLKPGEAEEGFVSLFNGRDLAGWVPICVPNNFVVKDGTIQPVRFLGGHLRSWEPYEDFIFRGEYWIEPRGNSGFFMRAPLAGRCSRIGFESQIAGDPPGRPLTKTIAGSIYDVRPPRGNYWKPDDWNDVEITCIGTHVKIVWNGKLAHDFHYEEIPFAKYRATRGYIGLQDHHNRVKFRNIRIKRLDISKNQQTRP